MDPKKKQSPPAGDPVNAPPAAYELEPHDADYIADIGSQIDQLNNALNVYLNHLVRARKLEHGKYALSPDRKYLVPQG